MTGADTTTERGRLPAAMVFVAVTTLVVALAALDARATYGARVSADEPQYLTTALSLAEDFDLDIADELDERRFLPYHEISLNPQTIELNENGQRLSPHDPLLPLVLAPAMGLGGWALAKAMLALLGAITAAVTLWVAVTRFGVSLGTATPVVAGFFATPPLTAYATQVYPELPAGLCVIAAVGALLPAVPERVDGPPRSTWTPRTDLVVMVAVVALPWLSVKYVPVAAVLALALLLPRWRHDRARALGLAGVLAGCGIAYLVVHQRVYGGWTVYAAGDHFVNGEFQVVGSDPDYPARTRRLIGLLVDRQFGLIPWNLAYLATVPALVALARRRPPGWSLLMALVGTGWGVATWVALTMHGWWWPGRQLVVILPVVVVAIAALVDGLPRLRTATLVGLVTSIVGWLWLAFEASTDRRTLIVDFFETAAPTYRLAAWAFPSHMNPGLGDWLGTALWTAIMATLGVLTWRRLPIRMPSPPPEAPPTDGSDARPADEPARP